MTDSSEPQPSQQADSSAQDSKDTCVVCGRPAMIKSVTGLVCSADCYELDLIDTMLLEKYGTPRPEIKPSARGW